MYEYKAKVVRVIDGDSVVLDIDLGFDVWLKNQNTRLVNIDAPESRTRDLYVKKFGEYSKQYVENYLPVDKKVLIRTSLDSTGKYGRILADIFINIPERTGTAESVSLNNLMITDRVAVFYDGHISRDALKALHELNFQFLIESGKVSME